MNNIFAVVGIGLVTAVLALVVKQYRPELGIAVSIAGGLVLVLMMLGPIRALLETFQTISIKTGVDSVYLQLILKIIATAYLIQFAAETAKDAGENVVASKIELAGKVIIFTLSAPVLLTLMDTIIGLIP